ncbi:glycosyltransferase [Ferrovibrio sp.]|uniref:glycosyltransferase n=1 Tax=Ferrovibrio sp. TaxID=1917215 RepID=UPI002633CC7A|nr:glycosyltransferase [Ferrovibrio sp.]
MSEPVLFVTQHYAPETIGSAPYCTDIAEYLHAQGRDVTVLTGWPHYPDAARFAGFQPGDRQSGRKGPVIKRLRHWLPRRRSVAGRIASEILFLLGGIWGLFTGSVRRHEVVLSLCPSIFAVVLGQIATAKDGRHLVVMHDIQSGLAGGLGMVRFGLLLRMMRIVERIALNRADGLLVLSEDMRTRLRHMGVRTSIEILPIWVDPTEIHPQPHRDRAAPLLLYSGNLGRKQGLDQVVSLAERLAVSRPEIGILIRGAGGEYGALAAALAARHVPNVRLEDLVPREHLADGLAEGDIHLVPQNPKGADFAVPSKIYNIMAAGRSCVTTAPEGSAVWRLAAETGAFLCVLPHDPAAFEAAILQLADNPGMRAAMEANGRRYIKQHHDRDRLLARLDDLLTMLSRDGEILPRRPRLLVLEPDSNGHTREWLGHIIDRATEQTDHEVLWLVLAQNLCDSLRGRIAPQARGRIRLVPLSTAEERACLHRGLVISGFARWWVMRRYLKSTGATAGHFLALDHLSLPFALGLGAVGRPVGGILFRPSVHYSSLGFRSRGWGEFVRDLRKSVLYRLMLLNRTLSVVLTLDPFFPDYAAESYRGGHKVVALPDPAFAPPVADVGLHGMSVPPERKLLLLFGALSERKGILCLLEALCHVPAMTAAGIAVVIAGKVASEIRPVVRRALARLRKCRPQLWLHLEDRWLEDVEIAGLVRASDVVLAPYQRFVGSSGVLLWAARAGVPVLTQDYGLIARLVREYRLGVAVDVTDPRILSDAITRMVAEGPGSSFDATAAEAFAAARSPTSFAATILATAKAA